MEKNKKYIGTELSKQKIQIHKGLLNLEIMITYLVQVQIQVIAFIQHLNLFVV